MTEAKESIRPILKVSRNIEGKNEVEKFQNITLRPIIKLQHELLVSFFEHYLKSKKINLTSLSDEKKEETIYRIFKNDNAIKIEVRGLIIGHFTIAEYQTYLPMAADINKRIMTMISQRLHSVY